MSFSSIIIGFGIFTDQVDEAVENGSKRKSCLSPTKIQRQIDIGLQITGYIVVLYEYNFLRERDLILFIR